MNKKIIFVVVLIGNIIICVLIYMYLYYRSKIHIMLNDPNGWCANNWTCNNVCPDSEDVNECYKSEDYSEKGLYKCLVYPEVSPCDSDGNCDCPSSLDSTSNCFAGCPLNLDDVGSGSTKCCCTSTTSSHCTPC